MRSAAALFLMAQMAWLATMARPSRAAVPYCNITEIKHQQLSNGVQLSVKADGVLEVEGDAWQGGRGREIRIRFANAKSLVEKNFLDISAYPVSHLQLCVPQGAREGVGIEMTVACYAESQFEARPSTDRTSYLITIYSERTLEKGAKKEAAKPAKEEKEIAVEVEGDLLTVRCLKAGIHELLGRIGEKTGINLALDDAVRREVSLSLVKMPADAVLRAIASAYGLALTQEDGVYMLSEGVPTDLSSYRLSGTASFPLRYTRASEASGLLPTFLYSYLHVNQPQNAVVVTAPTQMLEKIEGDLSKIDLAPPQILVEALAVEFASTRDLDEVVEIRAGDVTGLTDSELQAFSLSRTGEVRYSTLKQLPTDFEARLQSLAAKGRAHIHAAPRMAVMNGYTANFFVGLRRFIRVQFIVGGLTQEQIQGVDVGVKLSVTPWTGGNQEITVQVAPQVSNVSEVDLQTGLPVLATRSASTKVRVKEGETILIGGLTQEQAFATRSRIPLLGDLPIIGGLFRSRTETRSDSELVVFITPHLLTSEGRLPDEQKEKETRERFLSG